MLSQKNVFLTKLVSVIKIELRSLKSYYLK